MCPSGDPSPCLFYNSLKVRLVPSRTSLAPLRERVLQDILHRDEPTEHAVVFNEDDTGSNAEL